MIFIGKCPYRISLLGGGSDLDWFVNEEGFGNSIGFSLDKYSYSIISKKEPGSRSGMLNYSSREIYSEVGQIAHSLIRETLKYFDINKPIEMNSYGFSSGGGGLGGSSSFCMSFIAALNQAFNLEISSKEIAHLCSEIEINVLGKPIGRQDQYLASLGGINTLIFKPKGLVQVKKLSENHFQAIKKVAEELILIPSQKTRSADQVLSKFKNSLDAKKSIIEIRNICQNFINTNKSTEELYELLNKSIRESWEIKRRMSNVMDSKLEDQFKIIDEVPNNWIRLIGAGSGGYFLLSPRFGINKSINFLKNKNIQGIKVHINSEGLTSYKI